MMPEERDNLEQRYDRAVRLAHDWMEREGRNQSFLAKQLGVDRSILSRFLAKDSEAYTPHPARPRIMAVLQGIERQCQKAPDIFLSHRGSDKDFVRRLAADIEQNTHNGSALTTWLDEAEIRPGQSIPASVTAGLETSRFVGLVMTPAYFDSASGWTDAEWHSVLHTDPDNRRARLIPLLAADCPYIPALLRHLLAIDLREKEYPSGLAKLISILRDEPLPRPVAVRGQLIDATARVSRAAIIAERAIPEADPDVSAEKLYSNLLPIERIPQFVYSAALRDDLLRNKKGESRVPPKSELRTILHQAQKDADTRTWTPPFRVIGERVFTFVDLEDPDSALSPVIDYETVELINTSTLVKDEEDRKVVLSLINMAVQRHLNGRGLKIDDTKFGRFFFPPDEGKPNVVKWRPLKKVSLRTVAKPYERSGKQVGWIHQAAYIRPIFLAGRFFLQITPTRVLTADGSTPKGGPDVGRVIVRWLGQERNIHVMYNVRFWTCIMKRDRPGPTIVIKAGDQFLEVRPIPAFVQQSYGLSDDRMNLLDLLDTEAEVLAKTEEQSIEVEEVSEDADGELFGEEPSSDEAALLDEGVEIDDGN